MFGTGRFKYWRPVFLPLWHSIKKCAGFFFFFLKKSVRSEGNRKPRGAPGVWGRPGLWVRAGMCLGRMSAQATAPAPWEKAEELGTRQRAAQAQPVRAAGTPILPSPASQGTAASIQMLFKKRRWCLSDCAWPDWIPHCLYPWDTFGAHFPDCKCSRSKKDVPHYI